VPDRDDEVRAEDDVDLPERNDLVVIDVSGGPQDDERHVAVLLDLRPLVRRDGVLDGERMQRELVRHGIHLVSVGPDESDPAERLLPFAGCLQLLDRAAERRRPGHTVTSRVDGVLDDGHLVTPPRPGFRIGP
jgi:hypothetical protein